MQEKKKISMATWTRLHHLLFLFLLLLFTYAVAADLAEMRPAAASVSSELQSESVVVSSSRRRLNSFRICALCTCCGGPKGLCVASPCCYAINCHIPNRPFGYCAFTPQTCNCLGCHL